MKRIASTAAIAVLSTAAVAADLPSRKAPPPELYLAPPMTWAGGYIGVSVGGIFGSGSSNITSWGSGGGCQAYKPSLIKIFSKDEDHDHPKWVNPCYSSVSTVDRKPIPLPSNGFLMPTATGANAALASIGNVGGSRSGFIGGGQIGYNWQFGSFVAGVETDISGIAGASATGTAVGASSDGVYNYIGQTTVKRSLDYFGTLRARVGYSVMPTLLVYATGGMAYGGVSINQAVWGSASPAVVTPSYIALMPGSWIGESSYNGTKVGWTVGGGAEYMISPKWSAKLEYLYYDLGSVTLSTPWYGANGIAGANQLHSRFTGNIVRAGVNYHFNAF